MVHSGFRKTGRGEETFLEHAKWRTDGPTSLSRRGNADVTFIDMFRVSQTPYINNENADSDTQLRRTAKPAFATYLTLSR